MSCDFCQPPQAMRDCTFYDRPSWFAFLATSPNMRGHTVLAVKAKGDCPRELNATFLEGLDVALADVSNALRKHFDAKQVLFASLRMKDPHLHLHLFPVTAKQEDEWRKQKGIGYETGRFFEFLGDQERAAGTGQRFEREIKNWDLDKQRSEFVKVLRPDIVNLRACNKTSEA
jgi:diadenosine tetraphosphate (Ap4A) HIT family hydrolase